MSNRSKKRASGFSLLEMVIAMGLGTLVLGAAVQLYSQGVGATWTVSQRAEMQQDFRAASNMLVKDLSLAGAGLPNAAAITLPSTVNPLIGCDQSGTCYLGASNTAGLPYPKQGRSPGDHAQSRLFGKHGDQFFGHSVGKIILGRVAGEVLKGQDCNGMD